MRRLALVSVLAAAILLPAAASGGAHVSDPVEIAPGANGLRGVLFRPDGSGPFAAVVALHGCDGLMGRAGGLRPRYREWGERLSKAGLAVLYPDSYGSRGLGSQCRVRISKARPDRERLQDANAARRWLQAQPWVNTDRVALLGWSSGATAALWTIRPQAAPKDSTPDFRSAVALYPGCHRLGDFAWSARVPTLILIGRADDWTSADACERMVAGARGRSAQARIVVYAGAYHGFDNPDQPLRPRSGMAHSADGSGKVHIGTNARARADALDRVPRWLLR